MRNMLEKLLPKVRIEQIIGDSQELVSKYIRREKPCIITMERVLIVDDSPLNRLALKRYLIELGHEVVDMVATAEEAMEKFAELQPTLVTIDQVLPKQNGTALAKFINEYDRKNNRKTKLIIISSEPIRPSVKKTIQVDEYIIKPATLNKLETAINRIRG
ncbi:MAG: response regulator [Methanobacteriota archaeon]|nr:MAG: response regulator [Euryarchaeota archaeon]